MLKDSPHVSDTPPQIKHSWTRSQSHTFVFALVLECVSEPCQLSDLKGLEAAHQGVKCVSSFKQLMRWGGLCECFSPATVDSLDPLLIVNSIHQSVLITQLVCFPYFAVKLVKMKNFKELISLSFNLWNAERIRKTFCLNVRLFEEKCDSGKIFFFSQSYF